MAVSITKVLEALMKDPMAFYLLDKDGAQHRVFNIEPDPREGMLYTIADADGLKARVSACVEGCNCEHNYVIPQTVYTRFENAAHRETIEKDLAVLAKGRAAFLAEKEEVFAPGADVVLKGPEYESSDGLSMGEVMVVKTIKRSNSSDVLWVYGYKARGRFIDATREEAWRLKLYTPDV